MFFFFLHCGPENMQNSTQKKIQLNLREYTQHTERRNDMGLFLVLVSVKSVMETL